MEKVKETELAVLEVIKVDDYTKFEGNGKYRVRFNIIESKHKEDENRKIDQYYPLTSNLFFSISSLITGLGFVENDKYNISGHEILIKVPPKKFDLNNIVGNKFTCSLQYRNGFIQFKNIQPFDTESTDNLSEKSDIPF